jgi:hypothetical protein
MALRTYQDCRLWGCWDLIGDYGAAPLITLLTQLFINLSLTTRLAFPTGLETTLELMHAGPARGRAFQCCGHDPTLLTAV